MHDGLPLPYARSAWWYDHAMAGFLKERKDEIQSAGVIGMLVLVFIPTALAVLDRLRPSEVALISLAQGCAQPTYPLVVSILASLMACLGLWLLFTYKRTLKKQVSEACANLIAVVNISKTRIRS